MSLVNKMTAALMQKAKQVAKWRVSLLAWSMADYVEGKLKSIVEKDPHSREMFLAIEQEVTVVSGGDVPHRTSEGNTVSAVFKVFESFGKMIRDLQSLDVWSWKNNNSAEVFGSLWILTSPVKLKSQWEYLMTWFLYCG